jgi:hypothetical protein
MTGKGSCGGVAAEESPNESRIDCGCARRLLGAATIGLLMSRVCVRITFQSSAGARVGNAAPQVKMKKVLAVCTGRERDGASLLPQVDCVRGVRKSERMKTRDFLVNADRENGLP